MKVGKEPRQIARNGGTNNAPVYPKIKPVKKQPTNLKPNTF